MKNQMGRKTENETEWNGNWDCIVVNPRGPIDTQIRVLEICPLYIEEKLSVSEKAYVPKCVPQKQGTLSKVQIAPDLREIVPEIVP